MEVAQNKKYNEINENTYASYLNISPSIVDVNPQTGYL
jgi:hypothetical protein